MKRPYLLLLLILLMVACSPSEAGIQTAIAETQAAIPSTATSTSTPIPPTETMTPTPTETVKPTFTATRTATPTNKPTNTPVPDFGSRNFPYTVGDLVGMIQNQTIDFTLRITELIRGEEAWNIIVDANSFNDPAPEGLEYVLLKVKIIYTGSDEGALELNKYAWSTVSKGRVYDGFAASVCCLEPEFDIVLFSGGEAEGWVALLVAIDDLTPLYAIGMSSDGEGGVFFSSTP